MFEQQTNFPDDAKQCKIGTEETWNEKVDLWRGYTVLRFAKNMIANKAE